MNDHLPEIVKSKQLLTVNKECLEGMVFIHQFKEDNTEIKLSERLKYF
jgi:hypothetical protein